MIKKTYFVIGLLFLLITVGIYLLITKPSEEEKTYHRAALCYIIQHHDISVDNEQSFGRVKKIIDYSVPDYAYHKPKVYPDFVHEVIQDYFALSNEQKTIAKSDYIKCDDLLKK